MILFMAQPFLQFELGTFKGLWEAAQVLGNGTGRYGPIGNLFCSTCGQQRRVFLSQVYVADSRFYPRGVRGGTQEPAEIVEGQHLHPVFRLQCVQCEASFTAVMYRGPSGNSLCILPSEYGGLATPRSPESVRFYCDQASRAASVGAYTAAVAMLRPAVDIVLETQGYTKNWLGDKLADLERDITAGSGPLWIRQFNHEFLVALKQLSNDALHTKNGDVKSLAEIQDEDLYRNAEISIAELLDFVYEHPQRGRERLEKLRKAALPERPK